MDRQLTRGLVAAFCIVVLVGCAGGPVRTSLKDDLRSQIASTETIAGIKQNELYATIVPSTAGAAAAAGCGAVPGLGILLAAACGAAMGAVDAGVNAARGKTAEETVRPVKDALIDLSVDDMLKQELGAALAGVPELHARDITVTRKVTDADYNSTLIQSSAAAVMFTNLDYHLSPDFSTLQISAQALLYPRAAALRAAAGQAEDPAAPSKDRKLAIDVKNAIYRNSFSYDARLPTATTDMNQNAAAWSANNAELTRRALGQGIRTLASTFAMDLKQQPLAAGAQEQGPAVKVGNFDANELARSDQGQLVRFKDGTLKYVAELAKVPAVAVAAAPAAAGAVATTPEPAPAAASPEATEAPAAAPTAAGNRQ